MTYSSLTFDQPIWWIEQTYSHMTSLSTQYCCGPQIIIHDFLLKINTRKEWEPYVFLTKKTASLFLHFAAFIKIFLQNCAVSSFTTHSLTVQTPTVGFKKPTSPSLKPESDKRGTENPTGWISGRGDMTEDSLRATVSSMDGSGFLHSSGFAEEENSGINRSPVTSTLSSRETTSYSTIYVEENAFQNGPASLEDEDATSLEDHSLSLVKFSIDLKHLPENVEKAELSTQSNGSGDEISEDWDGLNTVKTSFSASWGSTLKWEHKGKEIGGVKGNQSGKGELIADSEGSGSGRSEDGSGSGAERGEDQTVVKKVSNECCDVKEADETTELTDRTTEKDLERAEQVVEEDVEMGGVSSVSEHPAETFSTEDGLLLGRPVPLLRFTEALGASEEKAEGKCHE